jgi:hypothetical protein
MFFFGNMAILRQHLEVEGEEKKYVKRRQTVGQGRKEGRVQGQ